MLTDGRDPETCEMVMSHDKKDELLGDVQDEMKSLYENHNYDLVKLPKGKRALKNKWVFILKTEENSSQPRYKAWLVVKGYSRAEGFDEIFSPIMKKSSIQIFHWLAVNMDLKVKQLDVKIVLLHGDLGEEIYMEQPDGFKAKEK